MGWSHVRSYNSRLTNTAGGELPGIQGARWEVNGTTSYIKEVSGGNGNNIEIYVDSLHKRVFQNQGSGQYTGPADYYATLTHDLTSHLYVLKEAGAGTIYKYRDYDTSWGASKGTMAVLTNQSYDAQSLGYTYTYSSSVPGGRISQITTPENYSIAYTYLSSGVNTSRLSIIDIKNASNQVIRRVKYTYYQSGGSYSSDLGTDGDLIMVESLDRAQGDDYGSTLDNAFSIRRTTQYRYYASTSADGRAHQLKAVYEPQTVQYMLDAGNSGITSSADILAKADSYQVTAAVTVAGLACRSFTYYTANCNTGTDQQTAWSSTDNLNSRYGDSSSDFDETGYVKSEAVNGGCASCGGGSGSGITYKYYYLNLHGGTSTDVNAVVRLTVEDKVDGDGTFVHRKILGMNTDRVALREVVAINPAAAQYWCTSTKLGAVGSGGSAGKPTERRLVSAHTKVTESSGLLKTFLDPTGSSGSNDGNTLNGSSDSAGAIQLYDYNSDGYLVKERIKNTQSGSAYFLRTLEYGNGTTDSKSRVVVEYNYPEETTLETATSRLATTYSYEYYSGDLDRVKVKTTTYPIVTDGSGGTEDHNGSGIATTRKEYYDADGLLRWSKDGEGYVTYYAYHPDTGMAALRVEDVDTNTLSSDITGDSGGTWGAWNDSTPPTGFTRTDTTSTAVQRTTKYEYDKQNRLTKLIEPGGKTTYTVYESNRTLTFPAWDSAANKPLLAIQAIETDGAGRTIKTYSVSPSRTAVDTNNLLTGLQSGTTQSHYLSLTRYNYDSHGRLTSTDSYHNIPASGSGDETGLTATDYYYRTSYDYDAQGRKYKVTTPDGTISQTGYDGLGRLCSQAQGVGAANLVLVSETMYDAATSTSVVVVGDGMVTMAKGYADGSTVYAVRSQYDWRGRNIRTLAPDGILMAYDQDNWGRAKQIDMYVSSVSIDAMPSASNLRGRSATKYDQKGQEYQTIQYAVNDDGTVGSALVANHWYDANGRIVKTSNANGLFYKTSYDAVGQVTALYVCYDDDEFGYAEARTVGTGTETGDLVIGQAQLLHDASGGTFLTRTLYRNDNATGAGPLGLAAEPKGRPSYTAKWYDKAGRMIRTVSYGTNEGDGDIGGPSSDFNPQVSGVQDYAACQPSGDPASPNSNSPNPNSSDKYIVADTYYDEVGMPNRQFDNLNRETRTQYDALGRVTKGVENYVDGAVGNSEYSSDRTTEYVYDSAGRMQKMIAYNPKGSSVEQQATWYFYGNGCALNNAWPTDMVYPDAVATDVDASGNLVSTSTDHVHLTYDRLGRKVTMTDQRGVQHGYFYDTAGRPIGDMVTQFGSGNVDTGVAVIMTSYDSLGRVEKITSYKPNGMEANEVKFHYNSWGTVSDSYQAHAGLVDDDGQGSDSPRVQYAYLDGADGSGNAKYHRLSSMAGPSGTSVYYTYADGGAGDKLSRLDKIASNPDGSVAFAQYTYLGAGTPVKVTHPVVTGGLELNYGSGGTYGGFDRFGRVVDQKWQNTAGTAKDRYSYTYDRNSNRLMRTNTLNSSYSEAYSYDGLNRLTYRGMGSLRTENWTLDALGNWAAYNTQGVTPTLHQTREHNAANEIADTVGDPGAINQTEGPAWAEPAYDRAGNMTAGPVPGNETASHSYTCDAWNRLVKVTSGETTVAEYRYDGLNRRIVKLIPNGSNWDRTDYYYNQAWQCLEEYAALNQSSVNKELVAGTHQAWYVWDPRYIDAPVLRGYNADGTGGLEQWLYYCQDANFNTTALVDPASGNVVERYLYDAYGQVTVCDGSYTAISWASSKRNEILYCGYRYDPETGLYQVRNRYLHPGLGRWISTDPDGYADGKNLYQYVLSNPVGKVDPMGLALSAVAGPVLAAAEGWSAADIVATFGISLAAATTMVAAAQAAKEIDELWERYKENVRTKAKTANPPCPPPDGCELAQKALDQAQTSIDSYTKRITKHQDEIAKFLKDPANYPGNAWNTVPDRPAYIKRVVDKWNQEIETYRENIRKNQAAMEKGRKEVEEKCTSAAAPFAMLGVAFLGLSRLLRRRRNKQTSTISGSSGDV